MILCQNVLQFLTQKTAVGCYTKNWNKTYFVCDVKCKSSFSLKTNVINITVIIIKHHKEQGQNVIHICLDLWTAYKSYGNNIGSFQLAGKSTAVAFHIIPCLHKYFRLPLHRDFLVTKQKATVLKTSVLISQT